MPRQSKRSGLQCRAPAVRGIPDARSCWRGSQGHWNALKPGRRQPSRSPSKRKSTPSRGWPARRWRRSNGGNWRVMTGSNGGRDLKLDSGATLPEVTIAYETYGALAADGRNAVLITHSLTSNHHAAGKSVGNLGALALHWVPTDGPNPGEADDPQPA